MSRMCQLDSNSVVHRDEDEKQGVCHEVLLAIVSQQFVILAHICVNLDWWCVDRLLSHKSYTEPDGNPDPKAEDLDR